MGKLCEYNLELKRSRTMGDETQCPASLFIRNEL